MNKSELIDAVAKHADVPKTIATVAVNALVDVVTKELAKGSEISLVGFGSFSVKDRPARIGRNPQTGKDLAIPASRNPVFKAGKALKESVN